MKALETVNKKEAAPTYNRTKSVKDSVMHKQKTEPDFVGSGYHPPERFVPLLEKLSHPANATQKVQLFAQLQAHYGNRYVQRVVAAYRSQNVEEGESTLASEIISKKGSGRALELGNLAVQRLFKSGVIQAKLRIGQPNDIYEQEADRVAEQVMRMPGSQLPPKKEEEEEEEELLLAKEVHGQIPEVTSDLESRIQALKGGGQPLPESIRAYFEPRFGYDFSQVRVHSNIEAAEMTGALNARAFMVGRDIVFGAGQYAPGTSDGKRLLAHELIHVVQQQQREATIGGISSTRLDHPAVCKAQHQANLIFHAKAMHPLTMIPVNTILRFPNDGLTIAPTDPTLRRVNPIDPSALASAEANLRAGRIEPVSILTTNLGRGTVKIVVDGVHRVQAAINLSIDRIPYESANEAAVRSVAQQRCANFDEMLQRAQPFGRPSRPGGGGTGGSLHGLARRKQALFAELDQTTRTRLALASRVRIYAVTFSSLISLIGHISAGSDILQMMSSGTTLGEPQRTASRISSQSQEALERAQSIDPGASFHLQTVSLISDAQAGNDSDTLFSLYSELSDFSVSLDPIVSEYNRLATALSERAQSLRETSDMFLQLAQTPQVGSTAGSASYVAMHQSLLRLSGTLRSAAARYRQAHQILNFATESAHRYSQLANQAAWRIIGEALTRELAAH